MQNDWFDFSVKGRSLGKLKSAFTLAGILMSGWAFAQTEDLTALPEAPIHTLAKNAAGEQVQIGDRIPLDVEIKPEWIKGDPQFKLSVPEGSSKLSDLGWHLDPNYLWIAGSIRIIISPIKSGRLTLPTLVVKSKEQDFVAIARTQPLSMNVIAPEKNADSKIDLLDPTVIPLHSKFILLGLAIFIGLIALGMGLARKLRRKATPEVNLPPLKVEEPEHIIAIKRIETLFQENSYSPGSSKVIVFGISEILKDFFSKRFKVEASESTTSEMLTHLRTVGMGSVELKEISDFFDELDHFKFIKKEFHQPYTLDTHQRLKIKALAIVQRWARQLTPQAQPLSTRVPS